MVKVFFLVNNLMAKVILWEVVVILNFDFKKEKKKVIQSGSYF